MCQFLFQRLFVILVKDQTMLHFPFFVLQHIASQRLQNLAKELMKKGKHFILMRNPLDVLVNELAIYTHTYILHTTCYTALYSINSIWCFPICRINFPMGWFIWELQGYPYGYPRLILFDSFSKMWECYFCDNVHLHDHLFTYIAFNLSCVRHPMTKLFPHHLLIWGMLAWSPFTVSCVMKENPLLSLIQIYWKKILRCGTVLKLRMIPEVTLSKLQFSLFCYSSYTQLSRIYFYDLILIFPYRMEFQLNNMIFF